MLVSRQSDDTLVTTYRPGREPIIPLEIKFYQDGPFHFAFDCRTLATLKLSNQSRKVLELMKHHDIDEIIEIMHDDDRKSVENTYKSFIALIVTGTLSINPIEPPILPGINNIVIMTAGGCNMGCHYCFEHDVPSYQSLNLLSQSTADEILQWFFKNHRGGHAHVQFYGGEPLLNWDIIPYIVEKVSAWASENGKTFSKYIITNGSLMTKERATFFADHDFDVQVSLDGQSTSNKFRVFKNGRSTNKSVERAIAILKACGTRFNVRAVVTNENPNPKTVLDELKEVGAERVSFGTVSSNKIEFKWTDSQNGEFIEKYRNLVDSSLSSASVESELPANVQAIIRRLRRKQRIHYACHAGLTEVTFAPDGSMFDCQRLMGDPFGHVSTFAQFDEAAGTGFLASVDQKSPCKNCHARYLCGGGCKESNVQMTGADKPWSAYCQSKHLEVEAAVKFIVSESVN